MQLMDEAEVKKKLAKSKKSAFVTQGGENDTHAHNNSKCSNPLSPGGTKGDFDINLNGAVPNMSGSLKEQMQIRK